MASWLRTLFRPGTGPRRTPVSSPRRSATFHTLALAEDASRLDSAIPRFVGMPNETPFAMLQVYRFLRDAIPDISDGVWTWKRLCQTGFDTVITEASSEVAEARAERLIE